MKKAIFSIVLLMICVQVDAQKVFYTPKWKKGEEKKYSIRITEKETENGKVKRDTTYTQQGDIKILDKDKVKYQVQITIENIVLKNTSQLYKKHNKELDIYKNVTLIYDVNRKTGDFELKNVEEAKAFIRLSMDKYYELIEEEYPDSKSILKLTFAPLEEMLSNDRVTEGLFEDEVWYVFGAYGLPLEKGKEFFKTIKEKNPLNKEEDLEMKRGYQLKSINKKTGVSIIQSKCKWDEEIFKNMMKEMTLKMAKSYGLEGDKLKEVEEDMNKKLEQFVYDRVTTSKIFYNRKKHWVTKVISKDVLLVKEENKENKAEVTRTFTLR